MESEKYLSVSELNTIFNSCLEQALPYVRFEGEISGVSRPASGHLYFTVKDEAGQVAAVMWRGTASRLGFQPETGQAVLCQGKPNVYRVTGKLQVVVTKMALAGEGLLQKKFLELKDKLQKEGLFDSARKREIPFLPKAVGVVTSKSGAVIRDIMVKIQERMPGMQVYLAPVKVQGEGSAAEIAAAIKFLDNSKKVDVIIVGRGGGSLEDLWAFNEEVVVRAIFASSTPIVSGVGHETDTALSDLVADLRAPTPTAAAEMVVPKRADLLGRIEELEERLSDFDRWLQPLTQRVDELVLRLEARLKAALAEYRLRLDHLGAELKSLEPARVIEGFFAKIETLLERLKRLAGESLRSREERLANLDGRLLAVSPKEKISHLRDRLSLFERALQVRITEQLKSKSELLKSKSLQLKAVSPEGVLKRGYSVVRSKGKIISSISTLKKDDKLALTFYEGKAEALVVDLKK